MTMSSSDAPLGGGVVKAEVAVVPLHEPTSRRSSSCCRRGRLNDPRHPLTQPVRK